MDPHVLDGVRFTTLVWLCPLAFVLHVSEEAPRFTGWVNRFISPTFTQRDYWRVHLFGIGMWLIAAFLVWRFPTPWVVFFFFTLSLAPGFFFNTVFHAGGTIVYGAYSPGVITGLVVLLPLFGALSSLALREGLLDLRSAVIGLAVAGLFHAVEVAHNTYGIRLFRGKS